MGHGNARPTREVEGDFGLGGRDGHRSHSKEADSALTLRNGSHLGKAPLQDLSRAQARSPTTPLPQISSSASAQCPTLTMAARSLWADLHPQATERRGNRRLACMRDS